MTHDAPGAASPAESTATIFAARSIVTMTDVSPRAFAAVGGRIATVGSIAEMRGRFPDAEVVDFGDSVILPGFNDAHAHLAMAAEDMLHLDLSIDAVGSLAQMFAKLREARVRTPAGEWIRGSRYDDAKMAEGRVLTRWDLDEISRDHPIMVLQVAGHWGVVNSKALKLGAIDEASVPPEGGKFGRDPSGRLNGILYEQAIFDYAYPQAARRPHTVAPPSTPDDRRRGLGLALRAFHAAGITSVTDALTGPADIALFADARRSGVLTMRINVLLHHSHYGSLAKLESAGAFEGDYLRFGGVKALLDGAIGGRTCLLDRPFEGTTNDYGIQSMSDAELRDVVRMVHADGNRICVHANGDRAIGKLLDILEAAHRERPQSALHHRVEHCTVVNDDLLKRLKDVGAVVAPFGSYVHYHGAKLLDWYGPQRLERMFAHRAFIDYEIPVVGSSDYPCGPFQPLLALQSCITRTGWDGTPLGLSQRITPVEALALYTVNAALASDENRLKGRLAPGYLCDFIVLDDNPLTVDPFTLGALGVRATYVGGTRVWERAA